MIEILSIRTTNTTMMMDMGMDETRIRKWDTTVKGGSATGDIVKEDSVEEIRKGIINNDLACSE